MRTTFRYHDPATGHVAVVSNPQKVPGWSDTVVSFSPSDVAAAAPDSGTLALLYTEGVVNYAVWPPLCAVPGALELRQPEREDMFDAVLEPEVTTAMSQVRGRGRG